LNYAEKHPDYSETEQIIADAVAPSNRFEHFLFRHALLRFINSVFQWPIVLRNVNSDGRTDFPAPQGKKDSLTFVILQFSTNQIAHFRLCLFSWSTSPDTV
jgi:hypothetical protein